MPSAHRKEEVERNFAAFLTKLPDLLQTHQGKFAIMHRQEIVEFAIRLVIPYFWLKLRFRIRSFLYKKSGPFTAEITLMPCINFQIDPCIGPLLDLGISAPLALAPAGIRPTIYWFKAVADTGSNKYVRFS
jgi:hypothetical protein